MLKRFPDRAVMILDAEKHLIAALERHGYAPKDGEYQVWLDEQNRVGEFEPVGAHPDFRRMGLGAAACCGAMRALRDLGADQAVVYPFHGNPAEKFYERLGFRPYARTTVYVR